MMQHGLLLSTLETSIASSFVLVDKKNQRSYQKQRYYGSAFIFDPLRTRTNVQETKAFSLFLFSSKVV